MAATATTIDSGDAFLQVEQRGVDAVPASERHGRPRGLALLWAGAFVNYASLLTASYLTGAFGLGVVDGFVATLLGTVAGALLLGLLSNTGPASGEPQIWFTSRVFGRTGMRAGAALTLFLAVGWFAVDCVIAGQAGAQLLGGGGRGATFAWLVAVAALSVGVAVYGHATLAAFEKVGAAVFLVLAAVLFAALAPQFHWSQGPTAGAYLPAFAQGFMVCFALVASWYPFASDYSRYLPSGSSRRQVVLWPVAGIAIPLALLGLFGLLLPTIDPKLASDPIALISKHAPAWVTVPFFAFVILGEVWANYLDVYTAGLVAQALGLRLKRWHSALGCGILGTAIAAYAVLVNDFHQAYENFLVLTYLWAPAWAGVVVLAFYGARRIAAGRALAAWAAGTVASLVFVNYPALFPGVHAPNQSLIDGLGGTDVSGLVSVAVALGVYAALARR